MRFSLKLIGLMAAVCLVCVCVPDRLSAQGLGSINGTVTDASGAVVAGAEVMATQAGTGTSTKTTTGSEGTFVFPILPPAIYNITATGSGFEAYTQTGLQLRADAAVTVNITLKTGKASETVTVSAETAQIDVTTGTLSQVIGQSLVSQLPLNGRNAAALTEGVAEVTIAPPAQADQGNTKTFPTAIAISANGTFTGQTNYMLDGGNNVDEYTNVNMPFPMPDAVQEFSIETNNYNAQYGQNAGGVVNIITKSGTNQYHGDLFEYVRNSDLNASNYFTYNTKTGAPPGPAQTQSVWRHRGSDRWSFRTSSTAIRRLASSGINEPSIASRQPIPPPFCRPLPRLARTRRALHRGQTTWCLPIASTIR